MSKEVDFQTALTALKTQRNIKRAAWPVVLILSEGNTIWVLDKQTGGSEKWQPTQRDLLATDWVVEGD